MISLAALIMSLCAFTVACIAVLRKPATIIINTVQPPSVADTECAGNRDELPTETVDLLQDIGAVEREQVRLQLLWQQAKDWGEEDFEDEEREQRNRA